MCIRDSDAGQCTANAILIEYDLRFGQSAASLQKCKKMTLRPTIIPPSPARIDVYKRQIKQKPWHSRLILIVSAIKAEM